MGFISGSVPGTSYRVTSLTTPGSDKTDTKKQNGIILTGASNCRELPDSNSPRASTRSSGEFRFDIEGSSTNDSGIIMTHKEVIKVFKQYNKDQVEVLIERNKRESGLLSASSSSSSDAIASTESTPEIAEARLKLTPEQLELSVTELTKEITKLKKRAEVIKTYEQYAKVATSLADLLTTAILVAIAGTATPTIAIPFIAKTLVLQRDVGNAVLARENSQRVNRDLPPLDGGTDFLEAIGRSVGWRLQRSELGQRLEISNLDIKRSSKFSAKCTSGAMDALTTTSTYFSPVLSGILKNANWISSLGRVGVNWFIGTVLARGEAKKEQVKYMEEVLKVVVAHQKIFEDIENAKTAQNHAETAEKLEEARKLIGETQIVIEDKTITINQLIDELEVKEQTIAESQAQHKTIEELLVDAKTEIKGLEKYVAVIEQELVESREQRTEEQVSVLRRRRNSAIS